MRTGKWFVLAVVVSSGVLVGAPPASAHALAVSSSPPAGSTVTQGPPTVSIVFSEAPDPHLSTIRVLDAAGTPHQAGPTTAVPGQPNSLEVQVGPLSIGVYTVTWRTVSRVDGHLASGSFAFGVRVTPSAVSSVVRSPPASTWAVAARWSFYIGVIGLLGIAVVGGLARPTDSLRMLGLAAWLVAAQGVGALEEQQRRADGIALGHLLSSSLGHQVLWRAIPLLIAGLGLTWMAVRPAARSPLVVVGASALAAMYGDVEASHVSGEHSWRWFHLLTQWLHFASAGVWLGGLGALLAVIGTLDKLDRRRLVTRFSNLALLSVLVLATTGLLRGLDEIRSWHGLFDTTFGKWALLKIGLLGLLLGLGLLQRTRGVRRAAEGKLRVLRGTGTTELAVAAIVLVAAAFLQSLAPPSAGIGPSAPKPLEVSGQDFATTVRVRLQISPGEPGFNRFSLRALDYDTLRPVAAQTVSLTFALPSRPDLGTSTLNLSELPDGDYTAVAPNLSVAGTWTITVLVQTRSHSAEVPLTITTRSPPVKIDTSRSPGLPTVYTIHVRPTVSIQVYLDPGRPGFNEFHVTVLGRDGNEVPTGEIAVHAAKGGATASQLTTRRLDPIGHYVADLPGATTGTYDFSIDATTDEGSLHADITISVP